jgi:phenylacetate-CoA ligase
MLYLERWTHEIVKAALGIERVTRTDLEDYQFRSLRRTLEYAYGKSSFYRTLFDDAGILPDDVRCPADLSRIPLTEPHHISEKPYRFLCVSQAQVARPYSFVTSGTTGPRKKVFWSRGDLDRIIEFMAAGIATVASFEDVVQIMLADGRPYSQADLLYKGVEKLGITPVLAAPDLGAEEHFSIIESAHSTVLFGYTGRIFRLSKELQGKRNLSAAGVKTIFTAGEYLPDAMRQELQRIWHCPVHTHYGLTEMGLGVAIECEARSGYHFNEAGLLLEVINPVTGEAVAEGEEGELVFTTLTREAMPLIRYRTHDISRLVPEPCPCGSTTLLKIDSVRKRIESIVTLDGGDEIYPSLFDDVLFAVPGLIDYQVVLTKHDGKEHLELTVEMSSKDAAVLPDIHRNLLRVKPIARSVAGGRMIEPTIHCGVLQPTGRAKKLLVDNRQSVVGSGQ